MASKGFKSMTDSLIEYAVLNFSEVFCMKRLKYIIYSRENILPPYLFEKILLKSKEIKWFIQLDYLKNVLPRRDLLQWKNIDLLTFSRNKTMDESILHQMSRVNYPIKSLSIWVDILTDDGIRSLCAMGSTIESLQLQCRHRRFTKFPRSPFPKLKTLIINDKGRLPKDPLNIDFSCLSDTLEHLILEWEKLTDSSFRSLATLKNLKSLSLPHTQAKYTLFPEVLSSLNQLRSVDMRIIMGAYYGLIPNLSATISLMPNLECCDTYFYRGGLPEFMSCRKWKTFRRCSLGISLKDYKRDYGYSKLSKKKVLSLLNEAVLPAFERFGPEVTYPSKIIEIILKFLPRIPHNQMSMVENTLLDITAQIKKSSPTVYINEYLDSNRCSQEFLTKLSNIVFSYCDNENSLEKLRTLMETLDRRTEEEQWRIEFYCFFTRRSMSKYLRDVIKKNLNNFFGMKALRSIFFVFFKEKEMRDLGLQEVFERAIKNNHVDEEALKATMSILDHINEEHYERIQAY